MLDFYADWCVSCKEMEKFTFSQPDVQQALAGFVLLKADVTANDDADQALLKRFALFGPPATIFFSDGAEHRALRLIGFEKADDFIARARQGTRLTMFNRTNALIVVVAIAGAIGGFLAGGWLQPMSSPSHVIPHVLKIGDAAPPVERPDVDGKPRALDRMARQARAGQLLGELVRTLPRGNAAARRDAAALRRRRASQIVGIAIDDSAAATRTFLDDTSGALPDPDRRSGEGRRPLGDVRQRPRRAAVFAC